MFVLSSALSVSRATLGNLHRITSAALVRAGKLVRTLRNRHEVRKPAELDERSLKDIGLTRSDVQGALAASLLSDPSLVLGDIAGMEHGRAAGHTARRPTAMVALPARMASASKLPEAASRQPDLSG
jgi:uncharacterized protein YjiS (DUF1127 family)